MSLKEQLKRDWLLFIVLVATIILCFFVYNEIDRAIDECNAFWQEQCGYDSEYKYKSLMNITYHPEGHSDTTGAGLNIPMQEDG